MLLINMLKVTKNPNQFKILSKYHRMMFNFNVANCRIIEFSEKEENLRVKIIIALIYISFISSEINDFCIFIYAYISFFFNCSLHIFLFFLYIIMTRLQNKDLNTTCNLFWKKILNLLYFALAFHFNLCIVFM